MRSAIAMGLLFVSLLLQSTVLNHMMIFGVKPDLILLVGAFWGFLRGPREGVLVGAAGGMLLDLWRGRWLGLSSLTNLVVGFAAGMVGDRFFKDNLLVPFIIAAGASFLDGFLFLALGNSFGLNYPLLPMLGRKVFPSLLYNVVVTPIVYGVMWRVNQKLTRWTWARGGM